MTAATTPMTGTEFLDSLDDGREVWIYGERVKKITEHPAFRNSAGMLARRYDALHDAKTKAKLTVPSESGGYTHAWFRVLWHRLLGGQWLSLADYVTVTAPTGEAVAAGCC